jgi:serine/threonine protein kinase
MNDRHYLSEQAHKFGVTDIDYRNYLVLRTCVNEYLVKSRHAFSDSQIAMASSEGNLNRLKECLKEQKSLPPKPSFVLVSKVLEDRVESLKVNITEKWKQLIKDDSPFVDSCQLLLHDINNLAKELNQSKNPGLSYGVGPADSENMLIDSGKDIRDFLKEYCKLPEAKAKLYAAKLVDGNVSNGIKGLVNLFNNKDLGDKISFITDEVERLTIFREISKKSFRVENLEVVNVSELVSSDPTVSSLSTFDGIYSGEFSLLGRTQKVVIKIANPRRDLKTENLIYDMIGNDSGHVIQKFYYHEKPEYVVLEYFGEDLRFYMEPNSDIKLAILKHVLLAVNFLHDQGICHLDLKPQNILVQPNSHGTVHVKVCDLESARRINDSFPFSPEGLRFTKDWVPPEVYANRNGNTGSFKSAYSIDMFALGLIVAALFDNRCNAEFVVYPSQHEQFERALTNQEYLYSLAPCDNHGKIYRDHVMCLLKLEPSERYSIRDFMKVLEENSISNVHKEIIGEKERHRKAEEEARKPTTTEKAVTEEKMSEVGAVSSPKLIAGKVSHVFLTHNWSNDEEGRNNHDRVSRINKALKRRGFITWFDEEKMHDQIRQKMTEGIFQTSCIVICVTRIYEKKVNSADPGDNCYYEFDLASRELSKYRVPVVMEECMLDVRNWKAGRLRGELGGVLYVDMSKDEEVVFERKCDELAASITKIINL